MERFTLARNADVPEMGTFGRWEINGEVFYTVERPWQGNAPFISCIPAGIYQVETHTTTTPVPACFGKKTWYLIGGSVGLWTGTRTRIAIHKANASVQLEGCIAPGLGLGVFRKNGKNHWSVSRSGDALKRMHELLPAEFELEIVSPFEAQDPLL